MEDVRPVEFSADELWLLHSVIRHEMGNQREWKFPPSSLELNTQIAEALFMLQETKQNEAHLLLSKGDLLCIDFWVRDGMKSAIGKNIGRDILLKVFTARQHLSYSEVASAVDGAPSLTRQEIDDRLYTFFREGKDAGTNDDPGNDADGIPV